MKYIPATYLDEANIKRLLTEALTADVQPVFPDQTGLVSADAAVLINIEIPMSALIPIDKDPLRQ